MEARFSFISNNNSYFLTMLGLRLAQRNLCKLHKANCLRLMSTIKFSASHEYVKIEDGVGTIGITQHAADALGDIVYVALPEVGDKFGAAESFGSVESVKAASDVYLPIAGEVIEINELLEDEPGTVNSSPVEDGWFIKVKLDGDGSDLMDEDAYNKTL